MDKLGLFIGPAAFIYLDDKEIFNILLFYDYFLFFGLNYGKDESLSLSDESEESNYCLLFLFGIYLFLFAFKSFLIY